MPLFPSDSASNLPVSFTHFHDESTVLSGNALTVGLNGIYRYGYIVYQEPPALNNSFRFYRLLKSGTYRMYFLCNTGNGYGKLKLDLDGNTAFNDLDFYAASQTNHNLLTRDVVVGSDGLHEFKFTVFTKHASSGNYYCSLTKIWAIKI